MLFLYSFYHSTFPQAVTLSCMSYISLFQGVSHSDYIYRINAVLFAGFPQDMTSWWHLQENHHNYASKSNSDPHAPEWPPTQHLRGFLRWLWAQKQPSFFFPVLRFCELAVFPHSNKHHLMCMYNMIEQNICKIEIYIVGCTRACPSCIIQTRAPEPCSAALLTWQFIFMWCPLQTRFTLKSAWTVEGGEKGKRNAFSA